MSLIEKAAKRLEELRRAGVLLQDANDGDVAIPDQRSNAAPSVVRQTKSAPLLPAQAHSRHVKIDLAALTAAGFVTSDNTRSRVADEFRVLKRPLIANASGKSAAPIKNGNLIMVTSALAGEGKSYCAVNLAISTAMELDRSVLLVDADVARPSLPRLLGITESKGLLDVLQDKTLDLSQVLLRTSIDKLSLLTSGTRHERATELLASNAMGALLAELASRYQDRIIIFDSPPINITTEARVLATHMGQIAFVVQAERTAQREVALALAAIESCPVKLLVLNQARTATQGAYGYGYGYAT